MYFPALLADRFLGQPRAFILSLAAILDFRGQCGKEPGNSLPDSCLRGRKKPGDDVTSRHTSTKKIEKSTRKTNMASGSRTLWWSLLRPVTSFRSNLPLCCRKHHLRLSSSEVSGHAAKKGIFQRRGFWLVVGSGALAFAAHNRLWERKRRRKLRVKVEGIGRFFR